MADEKSKDIILAASAKEITTLEIILAAKVERTAITLQEYIQLRESQGTSLEIIREDLLKDLEEGGRIFGEFKNAIKPTFFGSTARFRDVGQLAELGLEGKWRWVAVTLNTAIKTCPDCEDRHNKVKTWNEWEAEGLPRTNATVCEQWCRCILVSEEAAETDIIRRNK